MSIYWPLKDLLQIRSLDDIPDLETSDVMHGKSFVSV